MPPTTYNTALPNLTEDLEGELHEKPLVKKAEKNWKNLWCYFGETELKWRNIILLGSLHLFAIYSLPYVLLVKKQYFLFFIYFMPVGYIGAFGVTACAHRLYTHRTFKAKLPMRILLVLAYVSSGLNSIYHWVRDHRVHHKFSDTIADPHNAKRGFFFSHVGWLLVGKNSEVIKEGRKVDMRDVLDDPVIQFEEKYFTPLTLLLSHVLPIWFPWYYWNYDLWDCFCINIIKWVLTLNTVWSINSAAHLWGSKPYDKDIMPSENKWLSVFSIGEGWHNYHHTFPWDYKAAELGWWLNVTVFFLDIFASMGWIYDLKYASKELIEKVAKNKGDGSRYEWGKEVSDTEGSILRLNE